MSPSASRRGYSLPLSQAARLPLVGAPELGLVLPWRPCVFRGGEDGRRAPAPRGVSVSSSFLLAPVSSAADAPRRGPERSPALPAAARVPRASSARPTRAVRNCVPVADFWDTAGQERFQRIASYYHKAHACI